MIKGNIKSFNNIENLPENIKLGLDFIKNTDLKTIKCGKYQIQGDDIYANVQDYTSKLVENGKFEAHKKYIDIQYVIEGMEQIGVEHVSDMQEETVYENEKDIVFLSTKKDFEFIKLNIEDFVILYPEDAHMPSIAIKTPTYVKKVVVKVLQK